MSAAIILPSADSYAINSEQDIQSKIGYVTQYAAVTRVN